MVAAGNDTRDHLRHPSSARRTSRFTQGGAGGEHIVDEDAPRRDGRRPDQGLVHVAYTLLASEAGLIGTPSATRERGRHGRLRQRRTHGVEQHRPSTSTIGLSRRRNRHHESIWRRQPQRQEHRTEPTLHTGSGAGAAFVLPIDDGAAHRAVEREEGQHSQLRRQVRPTRFGWDSGTERTPGGTRYPTAVASGRCEQGGEEGRHGRSVPRGTDRGYST